MPTPRHPFNPPGTPSRGLTPRQRRQQAEAKARRRLDNPADVDSATFRALTDREDAIEPGSDLHTQLVKRLLYPENYR